MAGMNAVSLAVLLVVAVLFLLVELGQLRKSSSRSRTPIYIMLIFLVSVGAGFLL